MCVISHTIHLFRADVSSYEPWLAKTTYVFWLQLQLYTPEAFLGHIFRLLFNTEDIFHESCLEIMICNLSIYLWVVLKGLQCWSVGHGPGLQIHVCCKIPVTQKTQAHKQSYTNILHTFHLGICKWGKILHCQSLLSQSETLSFKNIIMFTCDMLTCSVTSEKRRHKVREHTYQWQFTAPMFVSLSALAAISFCSSTPSKAIAIEILSIMK